MGDDARVRIVIVARELRLLDTDHLCAQRVDARIGRDIVFIIPGGQPSEERRDGNHVLDAVIAIGWIVQRSLLVDDADAGPLRADRDAANLVSAARSEEHTSELQLLMRRSYAVYCLKKKTTN